MTDAELENERRLFEEYVTGNGKWLRAIERSPSGHYMLAHTSASWTVWLARALIAYDHAKQLVDASANVLAALQSLEPHLDAIVCYASTMGEHEPNRLVVEARAAIAKATGAGK